MLGLYEPNDDMIGLFPSSIVPSLGYEVMSLGAAPSVRIWPKGKRCMGHGPAPEGAMAEAASAEVSGRNFHGTSREKCLIAMGWVLLKVESW